MILALMIYLLGFISYIGYLCQYSGWLFVLFWFLFGIFALIYIVYFGMGTRPERSVYSYLLLICFFPKKNIPPGSLLGSLNIPDITGASLFSMLEIVAISAIIVACLVRWKMLIPKQLKSLFLLFAVAGSLSAIVSLTSHFPHYVPGSIESLSRVIGISHIFNGLIFLSACTVFITTQKHVEKLLLIFLMAGVVLLFELIIFKHLDLFPQLHPWVFSKSGRFESLIFYDKLSVGLFSSISVACALYFIISRKKYIFLLFVPFLFLPLMSGYARVNMLSGLIVFASFILMILPSRHRKFFILTGILFISFILFFSGDTILNSASEFLAGDARDKSSYFSANSLLSRVGAYIRAMDVIIYSFPLGVGPGGVYYFMSSPSVPTHLSMYTTAPETEIFYQLISTNEIITGPHNLYLSFVAEYGLAGVLILCILGYVIIKNFRSFLRRRRRISETYNSASQLAQVCSYSVLIGLGIHYLFQHVPDNYVIAFFFIYLTLFLPKLEASRQSTDSAFIIT